MVQCIYAAASAAAALWIGFAFLRIRGAYPVLCALVTGLLCGGVCYGLQRVGLMGLYLPLGSVLLCLATLTLRFRLHCSGGNLLLLFLITQSAFAAFRIPVCSMEDLGVVSLGIGMAELATFAAFTIWMRNRFPERDWYGNFNAGQAESTGAMGWPLIHLIPAALWALLLAVCFTLPAQSLAGCAVLCLLTSAFFWLALWLVVLITAYQRERAAVRTEQQYRNETQGEAGSSADDGGKAKRHYRAASRDGKQSRLSPREFQRV